MKEPRDAAERGWHKVENESEGALRIMNLMVEWQLNPILFRAHSHDATLYFTPCLRLRGPGNNHQCLLSLQRREEETLNFLSTSW